MDKGSRRTTKSALEDKWIRNIAVWQQLYRDRCLPVQPGHNLPSVHI